MMQNDTPIVLVVCNDYGELALAMYLLDRQSFAQNTTLMLPPRLYAKNSDVLPGRTFVYHSLDDIRKEMDSHTPGILGLFSGYLLPIHRLCDIDELGSLLRSTQARGWEFFTSDPFIGLLEDVEPEKLVTLKSPSWSIIWAIAAPKERRRLSHLLTEMHRLLQGVVHVYPVGESPIEIDPRFGMRLHFHNDALIPQSQSDPLAPAPMQTPESKRWLFVLGDQDYTVQLGKYGRFSGKFRRLLLDKLHETLETGRKPTLVAPAKVIEAVRKHSPAADSIELLDHCDYPHFQSLVEDAEYVFYWNAVSFTCILRTLTGKPWFTFDDGHLLRGMNEDYASRLSDWYYRGDDPPRLDITTTLTTEALQQATERYLKSAWRIRDGLLKSSAPQSLLSAVSTLAEQRAAEEARQALSEAFEILQQFGEIVSANKLDGSVVVDTALLAHPKSDIGSAVTLLMEKGTEDQALFARSAAPTLAFFQPGAGAGRHAIDSPGPDGEPWRTAVQAEMFVIKEGMPGQEAQKSPSGSSEILQQLAQVISANKLDGSVVVDAALLPHPKSDILNAVKLLLEGDIGDEAAFARSAVLTLAFFQSGVGDGRQPIDSPGPEGTPWRETVQSEMTEITESLPT